MEIIMPRIIMETKNKKPAQIFIGINIEVTETEVKFKGGFVKEKEGISFTKKKQMVEKEKKEEHNATLQSNKDGDIII